tara:strand:+ start:529 stop:1386 length:858 start_codon:yes stop_codon:yes gene_type:complete
MRIFIAGGTGFLGSELSKKFKKKNNVLIGSRNKKSSFVFDLSSKKKPNKLIKFSPDIIINCAALTDVDECEKNKNKAYRTNKLITKKLVSVAKELNCKFIQISTDHVYDNSRNKNSEKNIKLTNYYSKSKRYSEKEALKYNKSLILRTNFFGFSKFRKSNLDWFFKSINKKVVVSLFNDVYFSPIYIKTLCEILNKVSKKKIYGIFNVGSIDAISKKDFYILMSKKLNLELKFKSIKIDSIIKNSNFVKRPKLMAMNVNKFQKYFKIKLPKISREIQKFRHEYKN